MHGEVFEHPEARTDSSLFEQGQVAAIVRVEFVRVEVVAVTATLAAVIKLEAIADC